ncbi:MAG: hypothetical protein QF662_07205 [Phycisphaerae bacterium]|jgi:hypothetical protein|nr:hypothetical protein [Phycisphaerae bacterium]
MEHSYLLKPEPDMQGSLDNRFSRLITFTSKLCYDCDASCKGFVITSSDSDYRKHKGVKIGWGFYGDSVIMRIDGCENTAGLQAILTFLTKEGFQITPGETPTA